MTPSDLDTLCIQLAELQVRRKFYIGLMNKQTNAAGALVRRALGWVSTEEEASRTAINARAARIVDASLSGKPQKAEDEEVAHALAADLGVVCLALAPLEKARHEIELGIARTARRLPVFEWVHGVRGFGEKTLGVLIGETGNLTNYPKPDKLWKRLGLAPHDGKAYSTWRREGGLTAEDWIAARYAPRRRAEVYSCLSEPLFRSQTPVMGPYRLVYDARRARTAETHPDWTKAHSHADALRIMTKRAVSDLWSEWRRAVVSLHSVQTVPAADLSPQGAPPAEVELNTEGQLPGATPSADEAGQRAMGRVLTEVALPAAELREVA